MQTIQKDPGLNPARHSAGPRDFVTLLRELPATLGSKHELKNADINIRLMRLSPRQQPKIGSRVAKQQTEKIIPTIQTVSSTNLKFPWEKNPVRAFKLFYYPDKTFYNQFYLSSWLPNKDMKYPKVIILGIVQNSKLEQIIYT